MLDSECMRRLMIALALITASAPAAIAPRLSLESMIDRSPLIVEGHVTRSWTQWDPAHQYIWTHYEIQVADALRGSVSTLTVSEPGGSLDGVHQGFSGSLGYVSGEHVVLFLFRTPVGYWRTTGGAQGKVTVLGNGRVHIQTGATAAVDHHADRAVHGLDTVNNLAVSDFKSLVRSLAHSRAALEAR